MPRSRIPGSGAFVDRARRRGLGSCQTRGAWFATVCTHPTHVFEGGSCKGEEADGASIRGHLVSSQFLWEVKFASASPVEGARFELSVPVREGQCSSRLARYGSNPFQT
jgi:hypothetical protein